MCMCIYVYDVISVSYVVFLCMMTHVTDRPALLPEGHLQLRLKVCMYVCISLTVNEATHVLGDVGRKELGEGAGDAVLIDGQGDSVLSALHKVAVVIDDR